MFSTRPYFVFLFLAIFVVGITAGTALAHCGIDASSVDKSCETGDHCQGAKAGDTDTPDTPDRAGCDWCSSGSCETQTRVSVNISIEHFVDSGTLSTPDSIDLSPPFLLGLLDPPEQNS